MIKKIAFVTFVYPGVEKYLKQFIKSLNNQTDIQFDLIVHNDGCENIRNFLKSKYFPIVIVNSNEKNLFDIRLWTFNFCLTNEYSHVILGDSDDFFEANRVAVIKRLLNQYEIVINDISLVNASEEVYENRVFSRRIYNNSIITFNHIEKYNFIGFTNSAFCLNVLKLLDGNKTQSKIVDWYFYSILLLKGKKAIFTTETVSYYRQHEKNIAGLRYKNDIMNNNMKNSLKEIHRIHKDSLKNLISNYSNNIINTSQKYSLKFWWEK